MDSDGETKSTEVLVSSNNQNVTPTTASIDTIIQVKKFPEKKALEMFLEGTESNPEQLLRPEDAVSKDQEAASLVEFLWNDQHWNYLLQEVCSLVLGTYLLTYFFQLLLKNVEKQKSGYRVRIKPDLHCIRQVANAIYQDVREKLGSGMHFTISLEPENSAAQITDCILKWISMPQPKSSIQERASTESFRESHIESHPEIRCTTHRNVLDREMVLLLWSDYKALKEVKAAQELKRKNDQKQRNFISADENIAPAQSDHFMWSDRDWFNLMFELSAQVFGTRNPQKLARCSESLLGHVQKMKIQCNVRVKPDEHNIADVAQQIYKDLRQIHSKKAMRMLALNEPDLIIAAIPKHLQRIPKRHTLGSVLRSVCRAIFRFRR